MENSHQKFELNPDVATGRGIRRRLRDFFFLKTLNRRHRTAFAFFIEKATGFFLSVLAPIAKSGLKCECSKSKNKKFIRSEKSG
jgi:hypothetical protein